MEFNNLFKLTQLYFLYFSTFLQNLSPYYKFDNKTKRFDDENIVLALFILSSLHS
jgi:hypothetical protein